MGQGAAAGMVAAAAPETTEVELAVGGMTCAACAARVTSPTSRLLDGGERYRQPRDPQGGGYHPGPQR
jgi:hypothetical protein